MRNHWRLLLQRCNPNSKLHVCRNSSVSHFQVHSTPTSRLFSSLPHSRPPHILPLCLPHQIQNPNIRFFSSSELAVEQNKDSDQIVLLTDIFSKQSKTNDDLKLELTSNNIVLSHDLILSALQHLNLAPDVATAKRFSDWVFEVENEKLSSKSYNLMLGILGGNGFVKEFWDLVGIMKKKGYGVSKGACIRVSEKFEEEGLEGDQQKLRDLFALGSIDTSVEKVCSRVCKVIRQELWGDDVESKLRELNVVFSSNLVTMVLENLGTEPNKAFIFFRWVEEGGLCKHDEKTYNALARVLAREDSIDKFWKVVDEMRTAGYDMEKGTYVKVLNHFIRKRMVKDAVDLYEFAMGGNDKPSVQDCPLLLKKIVTNEDLDMDLFSKVVRVFKESGNTLTNTTLDAVLKSLTSVGRFGECNKILNAMEEGGFLPSGTLQSKIAFKLSSDGNKDEASAFVDNMEASGCAPNYKTWGSLIEGHCVAGHLEQACDCFLKMIEKEGASCGGYALELLINAYCSKEIAKDAYKLLSDMVLEKGVKPWHTTYKLLISKLLVQGDFKEATNLLGLMKSHGYPPFVDPFIKYVSKTGTTDDTVMFLKAMTVKKFPSMSIYIRVFEAYFKAGRHSEAQDFLSKCPRFIRNHADILNLFYSMKSAGEAAVPTPVAA